MLIFFDCPIHGTCKFLSGLFFPLCVEDGLIETPAGFWFGEAQPPLFLTRLIRARSVRVLVAPGRTRDFRATVRRVLNGSSGLDAASIGGSLLHR